MCWTGIIRIEGAIYWTGDAPVAPVGSSPWIHESVGPGTMPLREEGYLVKATRDPHAGPPCFQCDAVLLD